MTDAQLLDWFVSRRDQTAQRAFEVLVERHGPMVLGVCRGVLRDADAAQDAFQATFLVLIRRRSGSLWVRDSLGPWLHQVAYRTALRARAVAARRRRHEARAAGLKPQSASGIQPDDLGGIVQEEVGRLPERYRPAVVLCLLEGRTPEQAARQLGCPVGTVHSRLARGRDRLKAQLTRRGVTVPAGLAATTLPAATAQGAVPAVLMRATILAAARVAAGGSLMHGAASAQVAALVEGVLAMIALAKFKTGLVIGILLLIGISAAGLVVAHQRASEPIRRNRPGAVLDPVRQPLEGAAELVVAAGQSVQEAIDRAQAGATIRLAAGVFPEMITITKPVTLQGAGWDQTTVGPDRKISPTQQRKDEFYAGLTNIKDPQERTATAAAYADAIIPPTLTVKGTNDVVVRGIRFRGPPAGKPGGGINLSLVTFDAAGGTITQCAVIGPFVDGIRLLTGSAVTLEQTLVAALWGTGVVAEPRSTLYLVESDIRNCHYSGLTLRDGATATIERCRISGAAWHGIRYDDCSPTVLNNQIFGNARSGIYASGRTAATVRGNVFWRNEMDAISCWFDNTDTIDGNTIIGNRREGVAVLGGAKPKLVRNAFVANPIGIACNKVAANGKGAEAPSGDPTIAANFFFQNPQEVRDGPVDRPLPAGNQATDPQVGGPGNDFRMTADSPARRANAGALDPIPLASPFAIQPEETAMIPDSETRDSTQWKKGAARQ